MQNLPTSFDEAEVIINGQICNLDMSLNCKSKNVLYLAKCQCCADFKNGYFGQTVTEARCRMNGHRSTFSLEEEKYKKSALSYHCQLEHPDQFDLCNFRLGLVKKVPPKNIDREEDILIHKYKTHIWGLNRIEVVR